MGLIRGINELFRSLAVLDFLPALGFRLVLAYVFWNAGMRKFTADGQISEGFVGLVASMGFPSPEIFAWLAAGTEVVGAVLLLLGFGVRWIAIPLMIVMAVALRVHYDSGWLAIADRTDPAIACRLTRLNEIIGLYGQTEWLLQKGSFAILNNGMQYATYYLLMLASLFFTGGGRYVSLDDWFEEYLG